MTMGEQSNGFKYENLEKPPTWAIIPEALSDIVRSFAPLSASGVSSPKYILVNIGRLHKKATGNHIIELSL